MCLELDLHGLILCVFEDYNIELPYVHSVGIETFDPRGLILCVSEDGLS